jgi:hypothetical protein
VRSISNSTIPTGLPTFSHSIRDSSSMLSSMMSATRCRVSLRSRGVSAAHAGKASAAAETAASTSAAPEAGTVPMTSPVAGLTTSSVAPSAAGRQPPPMKLESSEDSVVAMCTECHVGRSGETSDQVFHEPIVAGR